MAILLGIDVGTSATKGVLVDEGGAILALDSVVHGVATPAPGWFEQDAEAVWWRDVCAVARNLVRTSGIAPRDIVGIGISAIGPCVLPVDASGKPLRPGILYGIDTRATKQIRELEAKLGADDVLRRGGNALSTQAAGPKIRWLADEEPDVFRAAARFHTATSYLVERLTGNGIIDHYTAAAGFTPLYDIGVGRWREDLANVLVPPGRLPDLAWPSEVAGVLTGAAALDTGLAPGTPVVVGTTDAAAEALSVGVHEAGDAMLMYGSTTFLIAVTEQRVVDARLWSAPYLFSGTHARLGGMATTGALTAWFVREFCRDLLDGGEAHAFEVLIREAEAIPPGADGLVVLPYFAGERTPILDPDARGVILGLTLGHTRGHVFRAILEGIAYGVRHHLEVIHESSPTLRRLVAVGGGTKNPLWLQLVSDVTGLDQVVPEVTVGAAYGDAMLAAIGTGSVAESGGVSGWVVPKKIVRAVTDRSTTFDRYYKLFRDAYESSKASMHALAHGAS